MKISAFPAATAGPIALTDYLIGNIAGITKRFLVSQLPSSGGSGGYTATVPVSATATGTVGTWSADANFIYVCYATNLWKAVALKPHTNSLFVSDGDLNGVLTKLALDANNGVWTNPHTLGQCVMVNSAMSAGGGVTICDHATAGDFTTNVANSFFGVDLKYGRALVPKYYSMRNRSSDATNLPRNWKLQGTNTVSANTEAGFNGASWTDLDTQVANATIVAASGWFSGPVTGVVTPYRYLRIIQNGLNSSSANFFCVTEIEFYGQYIKD